MIPPNDECTHPAGHSQRILKLRARRPGGIRLGLELGGPASPLQARAQICTLAIGFVNTKTTICRAYSLGRAQYLPSCCGCSSVSAVSGRAVLRRAWRQESDFRPCYACSACALICSDYQIHPRTITCDARERLADSRLGRSFSGRLRLQITGRPRAEPLPTPRDAWAEVSTR